MATSRNGELIVAGGVHVPTTHEVERKVKRENRIRSRLSEGRMPIGMQCFAGCTALVEIMGVTGFDFVMIDTEHASVDPAQVENLVRAADSVGLTTLIRVADHSPSGIRRALETGAQGVIIPQVRTAAEVAGAIDAACYPPVGSRGMCPATRSAGYSIATWDEYVSWTNDEVLVIPIIEHPDAVKNASEICALEQVDFVLFGPGDLGMALGLGANGMERAEVKDAFDHVVQAAREHGTKVIAVPFPDVSAAACRALADQGVSVLLHSVDELLFHGLCSQIIDELAPILAGEATVP